jgi:Carboxypeptidase regulatory-like domain
MRFRTGCGLFLMILAGAGFLCAQTYQGRILGTVTDASGAVVAGAKVAVTSAATGLIRNLVSNSSGDYLAADLDPGTYRVTVEAAGFKKAESTPVVLEVGRDVSVNLRLVPGAVNETMQVTAQDTLVDTTDSTLNGVLENKAINELPLEGRDFQNLLPLHPGVQRTPGGGFQSITSNGNRADDNNFFIDGATDNDVYYGESVVNEAGIEGTPASFLPLDAIQEFNTQESPTAEFGFKPGVVMNLGLKSGTNDVHGTAYYFARNSAVDARNFFDPVPSPVSALIMHQFGVSLGGPIKKDKLFYFVNYEGIRDKVGNPGVYDSPVTVSLANQMGGIADPTTGDPISATYSLPDAIAYCEQGLGGPCTPNPLSLKLAQLFLPNPGFTLKQSDPSAINFDFNNTNRGDNLIFKTDYHLNDHHMFSGRYFYSNSNLVEEDGIYLRPEWLSETKPITQLFGVNWTWTPNSVWVNEGRFSFDSFNEALFPLDHNVNPTSYGLNTGVTNPLLFGFPRINPGTDAFDHMGGNSGWPLETTPSATYSWSDTVSYTAGKHTLRFGGEFRYGNVNYFRATEGRGRVDFSDLTDFIAGDPHRWELLYGDPKREVSMKSFGLFLQDGFRATPRVTLNFGLRWDVTYPIKDSRNLLANYVPTLSNGQPGGVVQVGDGISQPYATKYNGISPRAGFAWDVFGKAKTIVRGGAGIIFEQPSIRTFLFSGGGLNLNPTAGSLGVTPGNGTINAFLQSSTDTSFINWNLTGPIFPGESGSGATCNIDTQCFIFAVNPKLRTPYAENWNLNLQQSLPGNSMLQVAYVGNHGVDLYSITDPNQVDPNSPLEDPNNCDHCESLGRPLNENCSVAQGGLGLGGPCFPYIGFMQLLDNKANSIYHSLQVTFTKRYSHGLYLLAGYTYAHAIDTATSNTAGVPQNSLNYNAERGNGDFDIRNRFTLSLAYEIPSRKSFAQMLEGWQVASIVTLEGGEPYTLGDFNDDVSLTGEFADRWNISGSPRNIHWSAINPLPYIDPFPPNAPSPFNTDANGNVISGTTPAAQACVTSALAAGGQAAANQLNGNIPFQNDAGFSSTAGGCYVSGNTVLTAPAPGTFGDSGRNIFRGPSFREWDFSLSKTWKFNERMRLQFRGEFFNILNHPNFDVFSMNTDLSVPDSVGTAIFTPDLGAASNPVLGTGGSRHIQLGVKIIW